MYVQSVKLLKYAASENFPSPANANSIAAAALHKALPAFPKNLA